MPRILITGASGFIGSHLIERLSARHEVFALARQLPAPSQSAVQWIKQDLSAALDTLRLPSQIDAIIHLAQSKHYKHFPEQATDIYQVNVAAMFQLLEYARVAEVKQFLFASTGGIYGHSYEKFVETDPVNPLNFYLSSKYLAELLMANYKPFFDTVAFRLFFVYGTGQSQTMLIPRLTRSVLNGEPITLQGTDGLRINPIHISDVVSAIENALYIKGNHLINIGGPQVLSLREIGGIIGRELQREPIFNICTGSASQNLIGDVSKMTDLLCKPKMDFESGVHEMCHAAITESNV